MKPHRLPHQPESVIPVEPGLELRELTIDEAAIIFRIISKDRQYLEPWLPELHKIQKPADYAASLRKLRVGKEAGEQCGYGIISNARIIGHISLQDMLQEEPKMCYWVARDESGKGIATKAVRALTSYGLQSLELPRVTLRVDTENGASNRVANRAGYTVYGYMYDKVRTYNLWSAYPWKPARPDDPGPMGY